VGIDSRQRVVEKIHVRIAVHCRWLPWFSPATRVTFFILAGKTAWMLK
jgi:hypothetical protein